LADDLSKKIFENMLLYSITENPLLIRNIIPNVPELDLFLKQHHNLVIYGAGYSGKGVFLYSPSNFVVFCDSNDKKHDSYFLEKKIISPDELKRDYINNEVLISTVDDNAVNEINKNLLDMGFKQENIYSLKTLTSSLSQQQYFDSCVRSDNAAEEVFIDAGSLDFSDSLNFIKWNENKHKKIIAFEPNPNQFPVCLENSKNVKNTIVHPFGLWNENTELYFENSSPASACVSNNNNAIKIKTTTLDSVLNGEKATFIKMDIEGAELRALKGAEQTILKHRPKLAICIYHKPEDVWEIPSYILSLHDDYKFFIRCYSCWLSETVLYAV